MNYLLKTTLLFCIFKLCSGDDKECTTPKNQKGNCISIYNCEELYKVLTTQNEAQYDYLKKSQCGYDKAPLVCCPTPKSIVGVTKGPKGDFLRNKQYCGYQHYDDYIPSEGPKKTNIDEFPWMASLLYVKDGVDERTIVCSGVLINERYVLTVAHCTTENFELKLVGVRLGEHNLHQDKDCNENTPLEECTDPIQEFDIEKITRHPGFSQRAKLHDIALLKLNRTAVFSDFIRPICLPIAEIKLATPGDTMAVSGWGKKSMGETQVSIKKKILVELISLEECQEYYNKRIKANISSYQICTKEKADTVDIACQGDSGGPTMFVNKNQWHVEGLVSFGAGCGLGAPDVNTRVISYLDWISEVVKS